MDASRRVSVGAISAAAVPHHDEVPTRDRGAAQVDDHEQAAKEAPMDVESCIPIIPSADLDKSLRFWVEGLGLTMDRAMRQDGRLVGCMVQGGRLAFWLNERAGPAVAPEDYEGVRLYWAPRDIHALRARLERLGYAVSDIVDRDYGQTEFFATDDDGYSHCFGVATANLGTRHATS